VGQAIAGAHVKKRLFAAAAISHSNVTECILDVLAAAFPGRLGAGYAGDFLAHV
jgi:hypothetical protein